MIDTKINSVDRAWPIMNTTNIKTEQQQQQPSIKTEQQQQPLPPTSQQKLQTNVKKEKGEGGGGHVVHVNPKFLNGKGPPPSKRAKTSEATTEKSSDTSGGGSSSKQVKPIPRIKQQPQQPRVSKQNVCFFKYFLFLSLGLISSFKFKLNSKPLFLSKFLGS